MARSLVFGVSVVLLFVVVGPLAAQQRNSAYPTTSAAGPASAPSAGWPTDNPYPYPYPYPTQPFTGNLIPPGNPQLPANRPPPGFQPPPTYPPQILPPPATTPSNSATAPATPPATATSPATVLPPATGVPFDDGTAPFVDVTDPWYRPSTWVATGKVTGGIELGINGSAGNAEALSFKTGFDLKHKTAVDELAFDLDYTKATANGVETQHNALFNASYERTISDSRWNLFAKEAVEYDEFKAFNMRLAVNGGVGYHIFKTDTTTWKTRFGAGASTEVGGPADDWVPEGVFGTDFSRQLTKLQKISFTSDYFPDWTDFENYRVVTKASYVVTLNEEYNLNLKLSINDRYDSTPNGRKPNDINYSILLLWKL